MKKINEFHIINLLLNKNKFMDLYLHVAMIIMEQLRLILISIIMEPFTLNWPFPPMVSLTLTTRIVLHRETSYQLLTTIWTREQGVAFIIRI